MFCESKAGLLIMLGFKEVQEPHTLDQGWWYSFS